MSGSVQVSDTDVWRIERLSEAAMRAGHTQEAIGGFALALRLRTALGMPEEGARRSERPPGVFDMRRTLGRAPTAQEYRDAR